MCNDMEKIVEIFVDDKNFNTIRNKEGDILIVSVGDKVIYKGVELKVTDIVQHKETVTVRIKLSDYVGNSIEFSSPDYDRVIGNKEN